MEQRKSGQSGWLLIVRSGLIGLVGLLLFGNDTGNPALSYSIAVVVLVGGPRAIGFGIVNRRTGELVPWSIRNGTTPGNSLVSCTTPTVWQTRWYR